MRFVAIIVVLSLVALGARCGFDAGRVVAQGVDARGAWGVER